VNEQQLNAEFAWIVTLQWVDHRSSQHTVNRAGTVDRLPGENRYQLMIRLLNGIRSMVGAPDNAVTLFLSIERNDLEN
jgi:hypothetical protein